MKRLCWLLLLNFALSVYAQDRQSSDVVTNQSPGLLTQEQDFNLQLELRAREIPLYIEKPAPNEISLGHFKLDGIAIQLAKTDNPLQLINPAAPERYGPAEDNVVRDLTTSKVSGLKLFQLSF